LLAFETCKMWSVLLGLMLVGPTTSSTWHYDLQEALSGKVPAHSCVRARVGRGPQPQLCCIAPERAAVETPLLPNGGTTVSRLL